ncbi:hypothetical protein ElyMa_002181200 [Elysia marginata]|uniref:Uncharacterized protein n=1 Tax=Elysia marginata TaxID=1093978 RepID=A0AAV4FPE6_9GAST|nr:hypothetical protein ElyMa_002181200 [Elysia marginata]
MMVFIGSGKPFCSAGAHETTCALLASLVGLLFCRGLRGFVYFPNLATVVEVNVVSDTQYSLMLLSLKRLNVPKIDELAWSKINHQHLRAEPQITFGVSFLAEDCRV